MMEFLLAVDLRLVASLLAFGVVWFSVGGVCWCWALAAPGDQPEGLAVDLLFVVFAWPAFLVVGLVSLLVLLGRLWWSGVRALARRWRAYWADDIGPHA